MALSHARQPQPTRLPLAFGSCMKQPQREVRRAEGKATKPKGMFGKQSADAAQGRKQTEAPCLGVICLFIKESSERDWDERGTKWGGEWGGVSASQNPELETPRLNSTRLTVPHLPHAKVSPART